MIRKTLAALVFGAVALVSAPAFAEDTALDLHPERLAKIRTVDERFQSYNVEMAEVIAGDFWKSYSSVTPGASPLDPAGSVWEALPPLDLSSPRLRMLAAALGPAWVRVSGTWANTAYFSDTDAAPPAKAPPGFKGVLTRAQWSGVIDFAKAADAKILTSFAVSPGVRDAGGAWTTGQARALLDYTSAQGGRIDALEFFNEPTMPGVGGAPKGYNATTYAADSAAFQTLVHSAAPGALIVGPSSAGEGVPSPTLLRTLNSEDLLSAEPRQTLDAFSYHFYGALSHRCAFLGAAYGTSPDDALSEAFLARTDTAFDFYRALQTKYAPGKPVWVTETAQAACGGDRWASSFRDSFRYLDQMGRLARRGADVIFHNTLVTSDYGLIDRKTLTPRPNYWAALLWRRLMGTVVLDTGAPAGEVHVYAQCLRGSAGGVALLAINTAKAKPARLRLPSRAEVYRLSAPDLSSDTVQLNGAALAITPDGQLPALSPRRAPKGAVTLAPATITFIALPSAGNPACGAGA